jgi:hypothetical protein
MLAVIDQNPSITWGSLITSLSIEEEKPSDVDLEIQDEDDGLTNFQL